MNIVQCFGSFDLDEYTFLDQQISDKIPYQNVLIPNFDPVLLRNPKVDLPKFNSQCIFINLFKKSGTKDIANRMYATDNFFRNLIQS